MPGGLREVVLSFKFRQNRMNHFRDVGVEICHFLYLRPLPYITACTTVQAPMAIALRDNINWISILGRNLGVDQYFCTKFGTMMENRNPRRPIAQNQVIENSR